MGKKSLYLFFLCLITIVAVSCNNGYKNRMRGAFADYRKCVTVCTADDDKIDEEYLACFSAQLAIEGNQRLLENCGNDNDCRARVFKRIQDFCKQQVNHHRAEKLTCVTKCETVFENALQE